MLRLGTDAVFSGIEDWVKEQGHTLVVTDDKEGVSSSSTRLIRDADAGHLQPNSTFEKEIVDAEILVSLLPAISRRILTTWQVTTPFHPGRASRRCCTSSVNVVRV